VIVDVDSLLPHVPPQLLDELAGHPRISSIWGDNHIAAGRAWRGAIRIVKTQKQ
jgi:hypothetical protein